MTITDEIKTGGTVENPTVINVGQILDDSKLNKISLSVIILCGLVMIMDGYDYQVISVAAPMIMKEWHLNTDSFGFVFSAAFFGYLFGAIASGTLSDIIGRKKTLILGACLFTVGTLLVFFSHSAETLIPMRVFAGIGIGSAVPCAITLTSEYSPLKGRGKYVSVMYSGFIIGIVLAGYIAGFMLDRFGWRPLFLVGFFGPLVVIGILAFILPESARWLSVKYKTEKQRNALIEIIRKLQPDVRIDAHTQFMSIDSHKEKYSVKKLFYGELAWVTPVIWAYYLVSSVAVFFFGPWSPHLLVVKGFTASTAAYITGSINVVVAVGAFLSGFYFDKVGFRWGSILYIVAGVCVVFMGDLAQMGFVILLFISGFFINTGHMDITILAPIVYPSSCRNQGAGTAIAVARIGAMMGPYIGGKLLASNLPMGTLFILVSIPLWISTVLCYIAGRKYDFYFAPLYAGKIPPQTKD
jgi:AAHS family 4-hydroxybenzoate transporter-like MFS transporter